MDNDKIHKVVRDAYGKIAHGQEWCGCGSCGPSATEFAKSLGYSEKELEDIPKEANLSLSCGNPISLANLREGEVALDLGSGAGFARKNNINNVEFRVGEIENLPVADNSIDVVIGNCVISLSIDKPRVFQDVYRVLKPNGRIAISDMALLKKLPENIHESMKAYVECVGGALLIDEYEEIAEASGLKDVTLTIKKSAVCIDSNTTDPTSRAALDGLAENESLEEYLVSVDEEGYK